MSIAQYTKQFNTLLGITEQAGVAPGWYEATVKIAYEADRKDLVGWETLKNSMDADDKAAVKKYGEKGKRRFFTSLPFDGLNNVTYSDIKKDLQNQWLDQGRDTMPTRIDHTIRLCEHYDGRYHCNAARAKTTPEIACAQ